MPHPSQIEHAISRLNETVYNTARANSDDFRRIISAGIPMVETATEFADDAGFDHGSDVPTDKWATTVRAGMNFAPDFNFQDIGYFLKDALGGYAVSGAAAPYIHTFTPQSMNTSRQLPSRTLLEKVGGIDIKLFKSIVCTRLVISGGKMGRLGIQANYEGSGAEETDPSGYTMPTITSDREYGYGSQASIRLNDNDDGTAQVETATAAGSVSGAGNINVTITAAGLTGSPILVPVAVAGSETAAQWADKVRIALRNHLVISTMFEIYGSSTTIAMRPWVKAANDATMNIAIAANGTGVTDAATSANTTAGVVGDYQAYSCDLESWQLAIELPPADPGYRACSPYVVAGDPKSGQIRNELLVGARRFTFTWGARLAVGDKTRDWMKAGTDVSLMIPILGIDANNSSLRLAHTRAIIDSANRVADLNGFVGINGSLDLMSNSGDFPFTAVLMNDVASYAS